MVVLYSTVQSAVSCSWMRLVNATAVAAERFYCPPDELMVAHIVVVAAVLLLMVAVLAASLLLDEGDC